MLLALTALDRKIDKLLAWMRLERAEVTMGMGKTSPTAQGPAPAAAAATGAQAAGVLQAETSDSPSGVTEIEEAELPYPPSADLAPVVKSSDGFPDLSDNNEISLMIISEGAAEVPPVSHMTGEPAGEDEPQAEITSLTLPQAAEGVSATGSGTSAAAAVTRGSLELVVGDGHAFTAAAGMAPALERSIAVIVGREDTEEVTVFFGHARLLFGEPPFRDSCGNC